MQRECHLNKFVDFCVNCILEIEKKVLERIEEVRLKLKRMLREKKIEHWSLLQRFINFYRKFKIFFQNFKV